MYLLVKVLLGIDRLIYGQFAKILFPPNLCGNSAKTSIIERFSFVNICIVWWKSMFVQFHFSILHTLSCKFVFVAERERHGSRLSSWVLKRLNFTVPLLISLLMMIDRRVLWVIRPDWFNQNSQAFKLSWFSKKIYHLIFSIFFSQCYIIFN